MRRAYAIGGVVAAVLVTVGAAGAWLGTQYTAQARVVGKGQTRLATSKPPIRLLVENADSLRDVRVTMDGFDLSRFARTDERGIVVRGINVEDGWHRVRFTAHQKGMFGSAVDRAFRRARRHAQTAPAAVVPRRAAVSGRTSRSPAAPTRARPSRSPGRARQARPDRGPRRRLRPAPAARRRHATRCASRRSIPPATAR